MRWWYLGGLTVIVVAFGFLAAYHLIVGSPLPPSSERAIAPTAEVPPLLTLEAPPLQEVAPGDVAAKSEARGSQFDLNCTVELITENHEQRDPPKNYQFELRIDLDRKEYCEDDCKNIRRIKDILTDKIILEDDSNPTGDTNTYISRVDLTYGSRQSIVDLSVGVDIETFENGKCELAPFKAFPETKI